MPHLFRSIVLDQVGSTNAEAFARAKAGETGPLWIMAHRQTQGRGRSGRRSRQVPPQEHELASAAQRHWVDLPGTTLYLATVDGTPAAGAVLRVGGGIVYLANASTTPEFRGRGCQTALLARRIADAAGAGCDLVAGQATFGSTSQRNMQRAGMQPAFTLTTWRMITSIGV